MRRTGQLAESAIMPDVRINLLGGCGVSVDGAPIAGVPSSFFRIVAYVLISGHNYSVTRQRLSGLLWPDIDQAKANGNLRQVLSRVRHLQGVLGVSFLQSNFSTVFISPNADSVNCDLLALLQALPGGHEANAVTISTLYSGDLLVDIADSGPDFEEWLSEHRETLRDQVVNQLTSAVQDDSALRETDRAISATRLLAIEPCSEDAYRALMIIASWRGQAGRVRSLYDSCQRRLMHDLGVRPSRETTELFALLTRQMAQ